ncbi:MAG: hypothetical protein Q9198_001498 [Flavoplaca austrocitrina]
MALKQNDKRHEGTLTDRFSFLNFPYDIRNQVYTLLVPRQELPVNSNHWAARKIGHPRDLTNLLSVNKQVLDEVSKIFYGSSSITVTIDEQTTKVLKITQQTPEFLPFPSLSFLQDMKHWQIDLLGVDYKRLPKKVCDDGVKEALFALSLELAKIGELLSLKVSVPCLCTDYHVGPGRDVYTPLNRTLEPLRRLRVRGNFSIILGHSCQDTRSLRNMGYSSHSFKECGKPDCLSVAASFQQIRAIIEGTTVPCPFSNSAKEMARIEGKSDLAETYEFRQAQGCRARSRLRLLQPGLRGREVRMQHSDMHSNAQAKVGRRAPLWGTKNNHQYTGKRCSEYQWADRQEKYTCHRVCKGIDRDVCDAMAECANDPDRSTTLEGALSCEGRCGWYVCRELSGRKLDHRTRCHEKAPKKESK